MSQPLSPYIGSFPFQNVEGDLFTPVCLRTHWDPTEMLRHILPQQHVGLPQDFRPLVKVCKNYVTSGPAIPAPMPPNNMVFPPGGEFYPPGRYAENIDKESVLRTLDHPLDKWCPTTQYIPTQTSNMYVAGSTVPNRKPTSDAFVNELSMPQALLRTDIYTCRSANDAKYFDRSARLFNNPTKQDRYGAGRFYALPGTTQGEPMPHGGVNNVPPTRQAIISRSDIKPPGIDSRYVKGFGSTTYPGTDPGTSFVGTTTAGLAAQVW